jgi:hypothetical protein
MNKFNDLYDFIDFAKSNRKYPSNTANGLKSALKIFEKELNLDELNSINLIEDNIDEIFINVVSKNKDKNIGSLNTYKARFLKIIHDYQKYGIDPSKMQGWNTSQKNINHKLAKKDTLDKRQDKIGTTISDHTNTPVHKIELSLRKDIKSVIIIPKDINIKEVKMLKTILDSLVLE